MPFITNTGLRDLKHSEFGTVGDPLVIKDLPDVNASGPGKGFSQQISSRADDSLRMTRLLVLNQGKRTAAGNKFTANLALLNQQDSINKLQKGQTKGILKNLVGGVLDTGKIIGSTLAQVPVAGTGTHFLNGGVPGNEYLKKGGGNAIGQLLRDLTGIGSGLQGHERVLSGRPINVNKGAVDSQSNSLKSEYERKLSNKRQVGKQRDSNLRQPYKSKPEIVQTRLTAQGDQGKNAGGLFQTIDLLNSSEILEAAQFAKEDIIPFEFQVFDPKAGGTPVYLYFRAYISSFNDDYTGDWNATKYIGRAEQLYNYTGFNRNISLSFIVAAHTQAELVPLYKKLNLLVGTTAPSYNQDQSFMRGVYTKLTVGDYLMQVPGFFAGINLSWDTNYQWDIGLASDYTENGSPILPQLLNVSMNFQPVHNFNPELGRPFITNETFVPYTPLSGPGINPAKVNGELAGEYDVQTDINARTVASPDLPPVGRPRRLRNFIQKTGQAIQNAIEKSQAGNESETVQTVDIPYNETTTPLDDPKNNLLG